MYNVNTKVHLYMYNASACFLISETVNESSNVDASSSESDEEPSGDDDDDDDESKRDLKTQYVHPRGKDKAGTQYMHTNQI